MARRAPSAAFLNKSLKKSITDMILHVDSTMAQVHSESSLKKSSYTNDRFQEEVIKRIKKPLEDKQFTQELYNSIGIWNWAKEGVLSQYFAQRTKDVDPKTISRFLKVAIKSNSEGKQDEVLEQDLEPWVEYLSLITNKTHAKFLNAPATKKQIVTNLKSMIDFPVSVKETPVNIHLTETMIEGLILHDPEKYLPTGTAELFKRKLEEGVPLTDILVVGANVIAYETNGKKHRIEGRIKASEALKWAKYITGIRKEPQYDGIGIMEITETIEDLPQTTKEVMELKHKKYHHEIDYRLPITINKENIPSTKELRESKKAVEQGIMNLLKSTYLTRNKEPSPQRVKEAKPKNIYGVWIDMKLKDKKAPIEIQLKDQLSHTLYSFNAPFGHNSKAYSNVRNQELHKEITIQGKSYKVDKITKYIADKILLPAFRQQL